MLEEEARRAFYHCMQELYNLYRGTRIFSIKKYIYYTAKLDTISFFLNRSLGEDGTVSRTAYSAEARQSLAEYSAMYREYAEVQRRLERGEPEEGLAARRDELAAQLHERQPFIAQVTRYTFLTIEVEKKEEFK